MKNNAKRLFVVMKPENAEPVKLLPTNGHAKSAASLGMKLPQLAGRRLKPAGRVIRVESPIGQGRGVSLPREQAD